MNKFQEYQKLTNYLINGSTNEQLAAFLNANRWKFSNQIEENTLGLIKSYTSNQISDKSIFKNKKSGQYDRFLLHEQTRKMSRPILQNTQQKIFSQVASILAQITQLTNSYEYEEERLNRVKQQYHEFNSGQKKNSQKIRIQMSSLIQEEQIQRKRLVVSGLEKKITIYQLINTGKLHQLHKEALLRKNRLKQKKFKISKQAERDEYYELENKIIQVQINDFTKILSDLKRQKSESSNGDKKEVIEQLHESLFKNEELLLALRKRLQLEKHIQQEQQNKLEFIKQLQQFRKNYKKTKQKYQELKKKVSTKDGFLT